MVIGAIHQSKGMKVGELSMKTSTRGTIRNSKKNGMRCSGVCDMSEFGMSDCSRKVMPNVLEVASRTRA